MGQYNEVEQTFCHSEPVKQIVVTVHSYICVDNFRDDREWCSVGGEFVNPASGQECCLNPLSSYLAVLANQPGWTEETEVNVLVRIYVCR